ncbi:MAG: aminotransferase class V-fold PLP-dependent enzyme [Xanthomonadales bacterium]|nr:aminotransferase class V-fold PLP-dependent enzyme [Xanthomonadales bacterium]
MISATDWAALAERLQQFVQAAPADRPATVNLRPMREIAARLGLTGNTVEPLGSEGMQGFLEGYLHHATRLSSPGFFAHQTAQPNAGSTLAALIDGTVSNPMAIFEMGPAAATIEYWLIGSLLRKLGWAAPPWPEERVAEDMGRYGAGVLVHGGSLATLTALVAARTRVQPDVWAVGNDPRLCLICAEGAHYAVQRAAGIMGLGRRQIRHAATDARGALTAEGVAAALAEAEAAGERVIAVIATAGSTAVGAFDPLQPIAEVCRSRGVWLHVDAAHGGGFLFSAVLRQRLAGIELADSVVWDAHKMSRTGPLCTAVLYRDERACNQAFEQEASYLFHDKGLPGFDFLHRTVECTKAALGLRWYLALADQGEAGIARHVEACVELTRQAHALIEAQPDFECALRPEANILCFRHQAGEVDELQIRDALIREGRFHLSTTLFAGRRWLRIVVMSPASRLQTIEALLDVLRRMGAPAD